MPSYEISNELLITIWNTDIKGFQKEFYKLREKGINLDVNNSFRSEFPFLSDFFSAILRTSETSEVNHYLRLKRDINFLQQQIRKNEKQLDNIRETLEAKKSYLE